MSSERGSEERRDGASEASGDGGRKPRGPRKPRGGWSEKELVEEDCKGTVKWFDPAKGFGRVVRSDKDDETEIYVHHSAIPYRFANKAHLRRSLDDGEEVLFSLVRQTRPARPPNKAHDDAEDPDKEQPADDAADPDDKDQLQVRLECRNVRGAGEDGTLRGHSKALTKKDAAARRKERREKEDKDADDAGDAADKPKGSSKGGRNRGRRNRPRKPREEKDEAAAPADPAEE